MKNNIVFKTFLLIVVSIIAGTLLMIGIFSVIAAFIVNIILRTTMKPVRTGSEAMDYVQNDKKPVQLSVKQDNYIRTTEKREKIEPNKN